MKLNNKFSYIFIIAVASVLYFSFTGSASVSQKSGTLISEDFVQLAAKLETGKTLARTKPFQTRKFKPYLNEKWIGQAVSYGCYRKGQAPWGPHPSQAEILEDLNIISQYWNLIRVYNADLDTENILEVIRREQLPIKMMLGVWLAPEENQFKNRKSNVKNVVKCLQLVNEYPEIIIAVNVGNETQVSWSAHKMQTENLIRYIRAVRSHTQLPVTTADDYSFWNTSESSILADEVDFIVSHMHPVWNGILLEDAVGWLEKTYKQVKRNHLTKKIVVGETGWATRYDSQKKGNGEQGTLVKGEISLSAQQQFLKMLDVWIQENQVITFFFEAFDEPWKGGGENTPTYEIEKNWGVFYENRTPKPSFLNYSEKLINKQDKNK